MVAFTSNRLLAQPAVGGDVGVWGPPLNNNQTVLDQILSLATPISFAAAAVDVAVSQANMQFLQLTLTGTPSVATVRLLLFANMAGFWFIQNNTPNAVQIITAVGGSTGPFVPPGSNVIVLSDGTNVIPLSQGLATRKVTAAGTVTVGPLDNVVIINKTVPQATTVNLPATGGPFTIVDGGGVAASFPNTITPASGLINGLANFVMNVNYQSVTLMPNGNGYNII
jgi:hypothetical protein